MHVDQIVHFSSRTKIKMESKVLLVSVCVLILNLEGEKHNMEILQETRFLRNLESDSMLIFWCSFHSSVINASGRIPTTVRVEDDDGPSNTDGKTLTCSFLLGMSYALIFFVWLLISYLHNRKNSVNFKPLLLWKF